MYINTILATVLANPAMATGRKKLPTNMIDAWVDTLHWMDKEIYFSCGSKECCDDQ